VYIVIGDGGNREGLADTYDEPQPEWSAFRCDTQLHFLRPSMPHAAAHACWCIWVVMHADPNILYEFHMRHAVC
jgi:hypothetical protein